MSLKNVVPGSALTKYGHRLLRRHNILHRSRGPTIEMWMCNFSSFWIHERFFERFY